MDAWRRLTGSGTGLKRRSDSLPVLQAMALLTVALCGAGLVLLMTQHIDQLFLFVLLAVMAALNVVCLCYFIAAKISRRSLKSTRQVNVTLHTQASPMKEVHTHSSVDQRENGRSEVISPEES
jgi:hypothetical protein